MPSPHTYPRRFKTKRGILLFGLFVLTILFPISPAYAEVISIGLLKDRDTPLYQAFWKRTAETLTKKIPGYTFVVKPLGLECLTHAISKQQLHFAITSPSHFILLEKNYDAFPIATLQSRYNQMPFSHYGATLITQNDRDDINSLTDLKGKHLMATSPYEFGGYQMIWRQLLEAGIQPETDFFDLFFSNTSDEEIVLSVLRGETDAAAIQSGVLERMQSEGKLNVDAVKIIHADSSPAGFPLHSTILYPEWGFIGLEAADIALARKVAGVLKKLPKNPIQSPAIAAYGWTISQDLTTVHGLLRALKLPPYSPKDKLSLQEFLYEHRIGVALIGLFIISLLFFNARMRQVNRKLALSQAELANHRDNLEKEVKQRTLELSQLNATLQEDICARKNVEQTLRRSQTVLQGFYQILVGSETDYLQKLEQLLSLAKNHFQMDAVFLFCLNSDEMEEGAKQLQVTASQGDTSVQNDLIDCLQSNYLSLPDTGLYVYNNSACDKRMFTFPVKVNGRLHSLLTFAGQMRSDQELAEVDKELLRLITQWIRSELERHDIEEDRERYRLQLGKVTRLYTMGEMASGLAHEINQPLTASTNYVSGSLRRLPETPEFQTVRNGLEKALDGLNRTSRIIRRLREFVQTGAPRKERFDFSPVVTRVLDLLKPEARQNHVTLIAPQNGKRFDVYGDQVQLEQVMLNLVRNAIDACRPQDRVEIELQSDKQRLHIHVTDTGQGIEPSEIPYIFDPFHTSKPFGMGLGLAISRSIVEAHNSNLKVRNTDQGAEFSFTLPLAEAAKSDITQEPE